MKKLYRSSSRRIVAGICGGIANILKINVLVVRALYLFSMIFTGFYPSLCVYLLMYIFIPEENENGSLFKQGIEDAKKIFKDKRRKINAIKRCQKTS